MRLLRHTEASVALAFLLMLIAICGTAAAQEFAGREKLRAASRTWAATAAMGAISSGPPCPTPCSSTRAPGWSLDDTLLRLPTSLQREPLAETGSS